jgi:protein-S-isoprenylcysteine O-methyltransferase Ste14
MRPLIAQWQYALVFWLVFVGVYLPESILTARTASRAGRQDAGSMPLVMVSQFVGVAAAFVIAFRLRVGALSQPQLWFWIGIATMAGGSILRHHCFRMLGASFSTAVVVVQEQKIVERGAYRWVRHPSYTGGLLMYAGMGLALGNWISVVVLQALVLAGYLYRITVEERALLETLGQPYREYMSRTKRFIPGVI